MTDSDDINKFEIAFGKRIIFRSDIIKIIDQECKNVDLNNIHVTGFDIEMNDNYWTSDTEVYFVGEKVNKDSCEPLEGTFWEDLKYRVTPTKLTEIIFEVKNYKTYRLRTDLCIYITIEGDYEYIYKENGRLVSRYNRKQ